MGFFAKVFTWWDGATLGTMLWSRRNGEQVGTDARGNRYFRASRPANNSAFAGERRWVIYNGANDASRVPAEWHGWLHGQFDGVPESNLPPARIWEVDFTPNATGTVAAYRPQGALERGGKRARATGDYEAWSPDGDDAPDRHASAPSPDGDTSLLQPRDGNGVTPLPDGSGRATSPAA